MKNCWIC